MSCLNGLCTNVDKLNHEKDERKKRPETRKKCVFACKSAEERHMFPFKFAVCVLSCKCCIVGFSFSFRLNWIFAGCKVDICLFVDLHCIHKYLNVCLTVCNDVCVLFSVTIFLPGFFFWSRDARFHFIYGKTHTFFVYNFVGCARFFRFMVKVALPIRFAYHLFVSLSQNYPKKPQIFIHSMQLCGTSRIAYLEPVYNVVKWNSLSLCMFY